MTAVQTKNTITLKGSVVIVSEYLDYAINSILYQRGLYPPEEFTRIEKYGLPLLITANAKLKSYLTEVLLQIQDWLTKKKVQRIVLLIINTATGENLERWDFIIECHHSTPEQGTAKEKDLKEINNEIRAVIRQITATVTFLPLLEGPCSFDIVLYTDKDLTISELWNDAASCSIDNCQEVRLRSFSTSVHTVDTVVSYKNKLI